MKENAKRVAVLDRLSHLAGALEALLSRYLLGDLDGECGRVDLEQLLLAFRGVHNEAGSLIMWHDAKFGRWRLRPRELL